MHTANMPPESMRIVTGCKTPEQFVAAFYRFCDAKTCFIPSVDTRPVGSELAFSLRLVDGTPMLHGTCVVKAAFTTKDNPFKRPGVQLEITKLSAESAVLFEQMFAQKTAVTANGIVKHIDEVTTNQHVPRDKAIDLILKSGNAPAVAKKRPPVPAPAKKSSKKPPKRGKPDPAQVHGLFDTRAATKSDDDAPTQPVRVEVALAAAGPPPPMRTPGSSIVLPANPLSNIDEEMLDLFFACTLCSEYESEPLPPPPPVKRTLLGS